MPAVAPMADDRHNLVHHIALIDIKIGPCEEGSYRTSQEQRADHTVDHQKSTVSLLPEQVARFALKFVADSLQYEAEKNDHPKPIGAAETGTVEQRK